MKKNERKKYEAIILNSILKEGSMWEFDETDRLEGKFTDVYRHYYRIRLTGRVSVKACIEYDANTGKYQVAYLYRHSFGLHPGHHSNFRWLGYLSTVNNDYLSIH